MRVKQLWIELRPFLSVVILIATLFSFVLLKMEVRRMGYSVLKATKEVQMLKDQNRLLAMEYARLTRPDAVKKYAISHLTMNDARLGQIIQLTGQKIALPQ